MNKGIKKCKEKNRVRVGWETEGPPQIQIIIVFPINGIAEIIPVITVAPQRDICPHGNTYPKKAAAIVKTKINRPDIHTVFWDEGEE